LGRNKLIGEMFNNKSEKMDRLAFSSNTAFKLEYSIPEKNAFAFVLE